MDVLLQEIGGWVGVGNIVGGGGVGIVIILLLLGKIRPQKAFDELREDRDARLAEVVTQIDIWKQALATTDDARAKLEQQLQLVMTEREQTAKIVHDLLQVVQTLQAEGGHSGEKHLQA